MILAHGEHYDNRRQAEIIDAMPAELARTLSGAPIETEAVIAACDALARAAMAGEFDAMVEPLLAFHHISRSMYLDYCRMFSAEALRRKVELELGGLAAEETVVSPQLLRVRQPLGVLLHIAAGNVDVLPAYSVVEGLLAGNINILKLPTGDSGVSVRLLSALIERYPLLRDYIYVFDVPSSELGTIRQLADLADAVAVWGGDEAVAAAHRFVKPNTRLICWGHKLSFAYAAPGCPDAVLETLALDICRTNQTLCSSCQGIYVDTDCAAVLQAFGARFFAILQRVSAQVGAAPRGMRAKNTLKLYTDRLEGRGTVLAGGGVSVTIFDDAALELSYLFRHVWVKALPHAQIIPTLKPMKGYLQSCALLLAPGEAREAALSCLLRAGLTRITDASPSHVLAGEAHDGVLPLMAYSRVVDICR